MPKCRTRSEIFIRWAFGCCSYLCVRVQPTIIPVAIDYLRANNLSRTCHSENRLYSSSIGRLPPLIIPLISVDCSTTNFSRELFFNPTRFARKCCHCWTEISGFHVLCKKTEDKSKIPSCANTLVRIIRYQISQIS